MHVAKLILVPGKNEKVTEISTNISMARKKFAARRRLKNSNNIDLMRASECREKKSDLTFQAFFCSHKNPLSFSLAR